MRLAWYVPLSSVSESIRVVGDSFFVNPKDHTLANLSRFMYWNGGFPLHRSKETSVPGKIKQQFGAEEARGAHNPEVPGSKPGIATIKFLHFCSLVDLLRIFPYAAYVAIVVFVNFHILFSFILPILGFP